MDYGKGNRNHQIFFAIRSNNKPKIKKYPMLLRLLIKKPILNLWMTGCCIIIITIIFILLNLWSNETMVKIYWLFDWKTWVLSFYHCRFRRARWHIIKNVKRKQNLDKRTRKCIYLKKHEEIEKSNQTIEMIWPVRIKIMCKLHIHLKSILYLMECSKVVVVCPPEGNTVFFCF